MLYNNLPVFFVDIVEDYEGVDTISLVDTPAVESNYIMYADDSKNSALLKYSLFGDRQILNGVAMIPDFPIIRTLPDGTQCYHIFKREAIERIVEKYFADRNSTSVNLNHFEDVKGCVVFESYLINREKGILPKAFEDYPDGTWIISMKINDADLWKEIKEGKYNGFSVEGYLHYCDKPKEETISTLKQLFDYLNN